MRDFFENPTIAEQAALVKRQLAAAESSQVESKVQRAVGSDCFGCWAARRFASVAAELQPATHLVHGQDVRGEPVYNEVEAARLRGELNVEVIEKALAVIFARHDNLRTTVA